jgi:hypothetical protein
MKLIVQVGIGSSCLSLSLNNDLEEITPQNHEHPIPQLKVSQYSVVIFHNLNESQLSR